MKNVIIFFISGFSLLIISCLAVFASEGDDSIYNDVLNGYKDTHQQIIMELKRTKKEIPQFMKMFQETRRLDQLLKKGNQKPEYYSTYQEQKNDLERSFLEKYALALLVSDAHFKKFIFDTESQAKIDKLLNDSIFIYKDSLDCFDQKTYSGSNTCNDFKKICSSYGSDNGDMYYYELTKELDLNKIDVSRDDKDLFSTESFMGLNIFLKDKYQFCRLTSMTTYPFSPSVIRRVKPEIDAYFIKDFYGRRVLPIPSEIQKKCIAGKPTEQKVNRLIDLWTQFPDNWQIKVYHNDYEKWQSACDQAIQQVCKNTYTVKEQIILTYTTVACEKREVTREDVERDISFFVSNADKLKHSTLLDKIEICQKAYDNGFLWAYEEPKGERECKKETPKTEKKK